VVDGGGEEDGGDSRSLMNRREEVNRRVRWMRMR